MRQTKQTFAAHNMFSTPLKYSQVYNKRGGREGQIKRGGGRVKFNGGGFEDFENLLNGDSK